MTDTTPTEQTATWLPSLSSVTTWKHVAALGLMAVAALAYFDRLPVPAWPVAKSDPVLQGQIDGLILTADDLAARIKTIEDTAAAKGDIARLDARLAAIEAKAKPAPVTTGSISKKR